ncbi:MAG: integrase core domain-containing protein [Halomonas sp.]|uniref:transposase n=1 Tax=Halomonas sp. TaxID=1486246 RepID=UPI003970A52E
MDQPLALRSDNGLVFSSRQYTATVKAYGLTQEFTTPYTPEQNGLVARFFRSLKEEGIWQHRFESLGQARVVIGRWIRYDNEERPHQSLGYVAPPSTPGISGLGCARVALHVGGYHLADLASPAPMGVSRILSDRLPALNEGVVEPVKVLPKLASKERSFRLTDSAIAALLLCLIEKLVSSMQAIIHVA